MKIFNRQQIQEWDRFTINEGINSQDLIFKASKLFSKKIIKYCNINQELYFFCGPGNNGADGLMTAKILQNKGYKTNIFILKKEGSVDFNIILSQINIHNIIKYPFNYSFKRGSAIIDALFGSGLSRSINGEILQLIEKLNQQSNFLRISLDNPSGLLINQKTSTVAFKADITLSIEKPKLSFMLEDCQDFCGNIELIHIDLSSKFESKQKTKNHLLDKNTISQIFKPRKRFTHKGDYGKLLVIGGSPLKFGCIQLAAKSALKSGAGSVTIHTYLQEAKFIVNQVPELMINENLSNNKLENVFNITSFDNIVIGPGIGVDPNSENMFIKLIEKIKNPILIDADGLNIIANNKYLLKLLPENTILTPHPGEFKKLIDVKYNDSWQELDLAIKFSKENKVILILKKAITIIIEPDGNVWFNNNGNPGMATAGSGDVLAGVIAGLLSCGFSPIESSKVGVFCHSVSGDIAALNLCQTSLIASDIIDYLPNAFNLISIKNNSINDDLC